MSDRRRRSLGLRRLIGGQTSRPPAFDGSVAHSSRRCHRRIDETAKHALDRFSKVEACSLPPPASPRGSFATVPLPVVLPPRPCHGRELASFAMSPSMVVADCPECRGMGTVILGTCGVCFAEFYEDHHDDHACFSRAGTTPSP
jgi:hypothetical protein